jgi:hypothetical protein
MALQCRRTFLKVATGGIALFSAPGIRRVLGQANQPVFEALSVVAANAQEVYAQNPAGPVRVKLGLAITVWKKTTYSDFSAIRPGDQLYVRGYLDASGDLVASTVWANIVSFFGMIVASNGSAFQVMVPMTGETKTVTLDATTVGWQNVPFALGDIQIGRTVQVIGCALSDGTVQGTRVRVYVNGKAMGVNGAPFGLRPAPILRPNGTVIR